MRASILLCLLVATLSSSSIATGGDVLTPHRPILDDGTTLTSAGGAFELGFFSPVGSDTRYIGIWFHKVSLQTVIWVANRQRPVAGRTGSLSLAANGTLFVTDNSTVVWSSSSPALANPVAQLLDDGNLVVMESGSSSKDPNSFAWQGFDFPTDTLLPGMKLGWNLTSGLNRNLTSWASLSDPAIGNYTMSVDVDGDAQGFLWSRDTKEWRAGPWNGIQFSGIPDMKTYSQFSFEFIIRPDEVFYSFFAHDASIISRLTVLPSGILQRLVWIEHSKLWSVFWFAPRDQCDYVSPCGPNGVCDSNNSPICDCLHGFRPKNPTNWDLRDGSDGCVRETALDCRNGTDGFNQLSSAKLPDTSRAVVNRSLNLQQCRDACLRNCSCTGYAAASVNSSGIWNGCIMWTTGLTDLRVYVSGGQDLYVRVAAADLDQSDSESKHSHRTRVVVIVAVLALAILLAACVACCVGRKKLIMMRRATSGAKSLSGHCIDDGADGKDLDLPLYDLGTIADATDNFSIHNKLGEGGYGPVYKGKLEEEQEVAIKRLSKTSMQGLDEFKNEVTVIAKLQHRNLVRLLGCCIQAGERVLIYEYMPNGSLDAFLFDKAKGELLNWRRRIFGGDETEVNTMRVVGTYGYMSPEYAMDGIFSVKSDVFSFGVLVLEIVSGKKNRGVYYSGRHLNLLAYTWSLWKEDRVLELVDQSIGDSFTTDEVLRCIKIGLLCVQEMPEDRPTMSSVVLMLGSDSALLPQPTHPGFVSTRCPIEMDSSISKQESLSINNVSVTMFEGR
ncbi:hypothetical protein OPV22_021905 [Ensete ventricosum]|uniref:Receptor-like serine/threonine-protein kinase n=1 Tax=Ensete ventricosum TaxID=4639 RepID=A0AAV8QNK6_ENSVE|nr:hypothetical protein OPV22_021905 [Ensete ventricosum]